MNPNNPSCPRCKTNVNVVKVRDVSYFRCAFCGLEFIVNGQQSLSLYIREKNNIHQFSSTQSVL